MSELVMLSSANGAIRDAKIAIKQLKRTGITSYGDLAYQELTTARQIVEEGRKWIKFSGGSKEALKKLNRVGMQIAETDDEITRTAAIVIERARIKNAHNEPNGLPTSRYWKTRELQ